MCTNSILKVQLKPHLFYKYEPIYCIATDQWTIWCLAVRTKADYTYWDGLKYILYIIFIYENAPDIKQKER